MTIAVWCLQKKSWMLLPWLVMSGLAVVLGVVGGILCVVLLPSSSGYKWLSLPVLLLTVLSRPIMYCFFFFLLLLADSLFFIIRSRFFSILDLSR